MSMVSTKKVYHFLPLRLSPPHSFKKRLPDSGFLKNPANLRTVCVLYNCLSYLRLRFGVFLY